MEVAQLKDQFMMSLANFNRSLNDFFTFVSDKLKNFKNLTLGEQVSYSSVFAGLALIITSIILFLVM